MKNCFLLSVLILCLASSCITLKQVDDINRYKITEAKIADNNSKTPTIFTFQIYKDKRLFLKYLGNRYDYVKGFNPQNFTTKIKDVDFNVDILGEEDSSNYIDFTQFIFKKNDPELVSNGNVKQFINIVVTEINGEDALANNSFYRDIVINYLDDLRTSFNAY